MKMTGEVRLDDGKLGQIAFRTLSNRQDQAIDGCERYAFSVAVKWWYNFHEYGGHLGNVG